MKDKKLKAIFTGVTCVILVILAIRYTLFLESEFKYDVLISFFGLLLFWKFYERTNQDLYSYGIFLFMLILHNMSLYATAPLGIRFDHYMHFVAGFTIAIIADRLFMKEKWGKAQRFIVLITVSLGFGAFHEIIEWLGYAYLAEGEGFLFYGAGDFGEWRNLIFDLIFNMLGSAVMAAISIARR